MARTKKRRKKGSGAQEFDPSRWAHAVFMVGAFTAMLMFSYMVEDLWSLAWSRWPQAIMRPQGLYANLGGSVIGLVLGLWAWQREKYFKFICEVATEVSQVVWPTRAEVRAATMVVIVITLICSVILFGMDQVWSVSTNYLYGL